MRLLFVNRYFHPDHSATSQMLSDLAFFLAGAGHEVCVVTSRQRYDDPAASLPAHERVDGVEVFRVRTTNFGLSTLLGGGWRTTRPSMLPRAGGFGASPARAM